MSFLIGSIKASATGRSALAIGVLLSSVVGLLFYIATANTIESDAQQRFDNMARSVQNTINGRIKSYTDVLRGSASLFQTDPDLTREQFHRYVEGLALEREFPGVEAINFARFVTDEERPQFEARMRKEMAAASPNYPPFRIAPPGRRPSYNVIVFIEPVAGWANRFGVDLTGVYSTGETPTHRVMRESGLIAASASRVPFLSGVNRTGLAIRIPIYRVGMPLNTVEQRVAAFIGSVGIGFNVQKLIDGVLDQMPVRAVRLTLTDIGVGADSGKSVV